MLDRTKLETLPIHLIAAILNPPFSTAYSWTEFITTPTHPLPELAYSSDRLFLSRFSFRRLHGLGGNKDSIALRLMAMID